ncbi:MAG TPA: Fe-S cluster assembly protein SufD [Thermoanaerobaculia bacterium]|nr:Fe-S cluster assembly protein SufD [Thermoanaerobaculia bacterium]
MKVAVETDVLQRIREQAAQRFEQLGWPTPRLEEWRYTNLAPVTRVEWKRADAPVIGDPGLTYRTRALAELVFVNGVFSSELSDVATGFSPSRDRLKPVLQVTTLRNASAETLEQHFARYADYETHAMVALNTANAQDGAVIEVDDAREGFIHLLFVGTDGFASHPRNLIIAGRASQLTVVETYIGSGTYFTNAVTEIVAGDGAVVDHIKLQCESIGAFHVGTVQVHQERASSVTQRCISIGAAIARTDVNVALTGEGASLTLDGLFAGTGTQHLDNHTVVDHVKPHCESIELYKGVLDEAARGIFDGRVIVREGAQKTVSRQENHNLLLSATAVVDSKPTLEILNDDVKCNHGSTIGQLDEGAMFYLRSRGIGEDEARGLLIYAFASEIADRIKVEPVREQIRRTLFQSMPDRLPERRGGAQ